MTSPTCQDSLKNILYHTMSNTSENKYPIQIQLKLVSCSKSLMEMALMFRRIKKVYCFTRVEQCVRKHLVIKLHIRSVKKWDLVAHAVGKADTIPT